MIYQLPLVIMQAYPRDASLKPMGTRGKYNVLNASTNSLREYFRSTQIIQHAGYHPLLGTPAPITPGSFSSPMLYSIPILHPISPTMATVKDARSQKGTLTSCFWHAPPPQYVVHLYVLSLEVRVSSCGLHWHAKQGAVESVPFVFL